MAKYDNILGCPGYYISKRGQIYSRVIPNGNDAGKLGKVWRERKVKIMIKTPTYSTKRVKIRNKSYSVSRLVALAWVPNPDNKPCVCHCDGVSIMELAEMFNTNKSMINKIIRYKFKELWQGRK